MAVNINFEDIKGEKRSLCEEEILRETDTETEDGVPIVKLISASTNSGMYWINAFNEENAVCTVLVDKETYQYVNMCTTPSLVFGRD